MWRFTIYEYKGITPFPQRRVGPKNARSLVTVEDLRLVETFSDVGLIHLSRYASSSTPSRVKIQVSPGRWRDFRDSHGSTSSLELEAQDQSIGVSDYLGIVSQYLFEEGI